MTNDSENREKRRGEERRGERGERSKCQLNRKETLRQKKVKQTDRQTDGRARVAFLARGLLNPCTLCKAPKTVPFTVTKRCTQCRGEGEQRKNKGNFVANLNIPLSYSGGFSQETREGEIRVAGDVQLPHLQRKVFNTFV